LKQILKLNTIITQLKDELATKDNRIQYLESIGSTSKSGPTSNAASSEKIDWNQVTSGNYEEVIILSYFCDFFDHLAQLLKNAEETSKPEEKKVKLYQLFDGKFSNNQLLKQTVPASSLQPLSVLTKKPSLGKLFERTVGLQVLAHLNVNYCCLLMQDFEA
jgi:hypothetical protein